LTPAIEFLKDNRVPFELVEYEHLEKGAQFAAEAIGMPVEQTIKTLIVDLSPKKHVVVLMPGSKNISFKALAEARGAKRAAMVSMDMAERLTGYLVGGISPFGTKRPLEVVMDASLMTFEKVAINGGKRGVMLIMRPTDVARVTHAQVMDL